MDWYDAACGYYARTASDDYRLSSLPAERQRELVALMLLEREVNNGGYLQFLANHGREVYEHASRALKGIGARRMADIIDRCQALVEEHYPTAGRSPDELGGLLPNVVIGRDGETVKEAGSVLPGSVVGRVSELSYEYMEYPDPVGELAESHYGPLIAGDQPPDPQEQPRVHP
jgi:hypothetical protein